MTAFPSFSEFYRAVWDREPYRWQRSLAQHVMFSGWPESLNLPTGSGKTSVLDIAIWALARSAAHDDEPLQPRRVFMVVDRRALVDQAWRHGQRLLERIDTVEALAPVRAALASMSSEDPLCVRLRGACRTDPAWCRSMDQVGIIASTVDQVGSRMLLRGYGVSGGMKPIEAALVAHDSLIVVDEAHLSGPFMDTLGSLQDLAPVRNLPARSQVVCMSATLASSRGGFGLCEEDHQDEHLLHRLTGMRYVETSTDAVAKLVRGRDEPCLLLVANTVKTALKWTKAVDTGRVRGDREVFLVTGRMRPADRDTMIERIEQRLTERLPTLVVSTQCIEAGLDWDFHGMVSECASWDSLVQRMGRVNRAGTMMNPATCTIVPATRYKNKSAAPGEAMCPVYGAHELSTWAWLEESGPLMCTAGEMPTAPQGCCRVPASAPVLLPEYMHLWSQTRSSGPGYDVSLFLHGPQQDRAVQVIWRDIDLSLGTSTIRSILEALPPSSMESALVPVWDLGRWLGDKPALRISKSGGVELVEGGIRAGDTVVVPCSYGGLGTHGTFSGADGVVRDISKRVMLEGRGVQVWWHDAPKLAPDIPVHEQVRAWIDQDPGRRGHLRDAHWVDAGPRWLFVSGVDHGEDDVFYGRAISLEDHCSGVRDRVEQTCERLGIPTGLASDLALAAGLHDLGKLDDRFQRMCGRRSGQDPLAKSGKRGSASPDGVGGFPKGERHEALSAEIALRCGLLEGADDPELVSHLIASHHGWCRPFVKGPQGTAEVIATVFDAPLYGGRIAHQQDVCAPGRFDVLQRRYGWLGLAFLESVLRLCDHRQSEHERKLGPCPGPAIELSSFPWDQVEPGPPELVLHGLHGAIVSDWMAVMGIVHGLRVSGLEATLRWDGTTPVLGTDLSIEEMANELAWVRGTLQGSLLWPAGLNKMSPEQVTDLLIESSGTRHSLAMSMISPGGRSDLDFVSGGRGGFDSVSTWAMDSTQRSFSIPQLVSILSGSRRFFATGKSFRWSPLSSLGASAPCSSSNDKRFEPWLEWLSMMGACAFTAVPIGTRYGDVRTKTTGFHGARFDERGLRFPLWTAPLRWDAIPSAISASRHSLPDAMWMEADRLVFGTSKNVSYGFGPGRPIL